MTSRRQNKTERFVPETKRSIRRTRSKTYLVPRDSTIPNGVRLPRPFDRLNANRVAPWSVFFDRRRTNSEILEELTRTVFESSATARVTATIGETATACYLYKTYAIYGIASARASRGTSGGGSDHASSSLAERTTKNERFVRTEFGNRIRNQKVTLSRREILSR